MRKIKPFMMIEVTLDSEPNKVIKRVFRKTDKAVSRFANKMYNQYGEQVTVAVYDENANRIMTYHA